MTDWEELTESLRRMLVDPATAYALAKPLDDRLVSLDERLSRIEWLLQILSLSQPFAVLPAPCVSADKE